MGINGRVSNDIKRNGVLVWFITHIDEFLWV